MRLIDTDAEIAKIEAEIEIYKGKIQQWNDNKTDRNLYDVDLKIRELEHNILDCKKEIRDKAIEELLERELEVLEDFKYWEDDSGHQIHSMSETQRISKCKELIKQVAEQMKEVNNG